MDTTLLALGLAAFLVGFAKTGIGGTATIAVALFAASMPARESTAALLLVLIIGDFIAISVYRKDCDWRLVRHLLPGVLPGLLLGAAVLGVVADDPLRTGIGAILLVLIATQLWLRRGPAVDAARGWSRPARAAVGLAAGATTMIANSGGAVMTLYLVGEGTPKRSFLGTTAWFFFCVNLAKLPLSAGLGLLELSMLWQAITLAPLVFLGGYAGLHLVRRLPQRTFEAVVLLASAVSAVALLVG
ncbi:sulfite exporter TauE/SafE family protein [Nocardioides gansuensis]|uniref:Probable membrane transporter protein n=1 Tax=Nocardioides gansuensis TaxID=2138300 RepID=A0A2T8FCW3_9ACTN|nr:sulfite exporter TauE/SafE family protein [Nocardioides gansuensis]PVG83551.1 sulfite exporter TauE/SafE family protein [Nocardioides gansuensis]